MCWMAARCRDHGLNQSRLLWIIQDNGGMGVFQWGFVPLLVFSFYQELEGDIYQAFTTVMMSDVYEEVEGPEGYVVLKELL